MLFKPIMQQFYLQNDFVCKFYQIETIQPRSPIEFLVKNSEKLYFDLTNSRIMVLHQIQKTDETPMPASYVCVTGILNLLLYSFSKSLQANQQQNGERLSTNMYAYRAYLETLINCNGDIKNYCLKAEE